MKYFIIAAIAVLIIWVWPFRDSETIEDYPEIVERGTLRAVTEYNSISYFMKKDTIAGFHYELIHAFAKAKGLKVEVTPEMSFEKRVDGLRSGQFDVIACEVPVTSEMKNTMLFTIPITKNRQVLVQRKEKADSTTYISSHLQLAKKHIHVAKSSPSILRLRHLAHEMADTIHIEEIEKYGAEQLIAMVAHGDIDYTVTDEKVALAAIDSFPQLDIMTISFTQFYAWAVKEESAALRDTLDAWLTGYMKTKAFRRTYQKYF